jgi:hypothetical protein
MFTGLVMKCTASKKLDEIMGFTGKNFISMLAVSFMQNFKTIQSGHIACGLYSLPQDLLT